jgi:hypothetical protein
LRFFIHILSIFSATGLFAQEKPVTISAHVIGEDSRPMGNVMVINKRTSLGFIAEINGSFKTAAFKSDTFIVLCRGFNDLKFSLRDSANKEIYPLTLRMTRKAYKPKEVPVDPKPKKAPPKPPAPLVKNDTIPRDSLYDYFDPEAYKLKQVTIYAIKKQEIIRKEIDSLQLQNTDDYQHYNSLESPITALYERFSKREADKRKVAELIYEDRKKEVLRDLLALYISYDILELSDEEFTEFLNGVYVPDDVLKNYSDYQLGEFVRKQYIAYKEYKKQHGDYDDAFKKFNSGK